MFVPLKKMRVREEISQRRFDQNWANQLAREFNIDYFEPPTVNKVGEWYWIIDGQHSTWAFKKWIGDWGDQKVQCWVYHGLSEQEEANMFDRLNTIKVVGSFDRFAVRLTAGQEIEINVDAIVRLKKLKISRRKGEGAISCPGTLVRVYRRGPDCLSRGLSIAYESFGDYGLESDILDGLGLLINRYDGRLDDKRAIRTLRSVRGGANTLRNRAARLHQQVGAPRAQCIAAAAVEVYNRGRGGKKLPGWWKLDA